MVDNYFDVIMGYSIDDYEDKLYKVFKILDKCLRKLDVVIEDIGIVSIVGGSVLIVGGGMVVVGFGLVLIIVGVSLGFIIVGIVMGFVGGFILIVSFLVSLYWDKSEVKKVEKVIVFFIYVIFSLYGFFEEYINILKDVNEFLEKFEGEVVVKDLYRVVKVIKVVGEVVWRVYNIGDVVCMGVIYVK